MAAAPRIVTGEPLAGGFVLLWARVDQLDWALERLHGIAEHPRGARHERTTSIPLLDDFTHKLGLPTAFGIAAQVRRGNISCRALLLEPAAAPAAVRAELERRYPSGSDKPPSPRAAAAALARLDADGDDLRDVVLTDRAVTGKHRDPNGIDADASPALLGFNLFSHTLARAVIVATYET